WSRAAQDSEALLRALAERELALVACGIDLERALGPERGALGKDLRGRIDEAARKRGLGVDVLDVGLEDVHPPLARAAAFEIETTALFLSDARRLAGAADAARAGPRGLAEAEAIRLRAAAVKETRERLARAEAERFLALRELERGAPRAFR